MLKIKTYYFQLLSGVCLISFSAIFVKMVPVHATVSAFFRCFYAFLILMLISFTDRKNQFQSRNYRWLGPAFWAGLFLAVDLVIWHKTIFFIGTGPATFMGNTQIIFMTVMAAIFYKEKIDPVFYFLVPVILFGFYLLIPDTHILVSVKTGFYLGLAVGISYALFLIFLRKEKDKAGDTYPEIFSLAIVMLITSLFIFPYGILIEKVSYLVAGWQTHGIMLLMALASQSFGWILIKSGINRVPAHRGSLLLLIQPILTTIWGVLFFHEPFTMVQFTGMILALGGIAFYQLKYS